MEETQKIIITDTHFGVRNNSMKFLESQKKLFSQLYDYMLHCENSRFDLIHLGDLFDSRSTVSFYIMSEVKNILLRLNEILKYRNKENRFIFVAGNHDFYSPLDDNINSLDTYIRHLLPDAIVVDRYCWYDNGDLYIPWYQMNDEEKFKLVQQEALFKGGELEVRRVFTHTDLKFMQYGKFPVNCSVYSGHIHQYHMYHNMLSSNPYSLLHNLSTSYSLDFGDSNDNKKGIWLLDGRDLKLIENKDSIKFRTFVNEEIFDIPDLDEAIERADNFRIYLTEENRTRMNYIERINELSTDLKYVNIILINKENLNESVTVGSLDIEDMLKEMIPDHIQDCFDTVKKEIHNEE